MEEEEEGINNLKYVCKFCKKRFPCGRSLGGHMRSHLTNTSSEKTTTKLINNSSSTTSLDKYYVLRDNPKKLEKGFQSEKKRKRSERKRRRRRNSEEEQEEAVAMCLMMLSRDHHNMLGKQEMKRSGFECATCNKTFDSYQALGGHRASHNNSKTCFNSTTTTDQSENSIVDQQEEEEEEYSISKAVKQIKTSTSNSNKGHECPICLKVFPSGQALGGHKRSHLIVRQRKGIDVVEKPVPKIRNLLDLNLPAPDNDDHEQQQQQDTNGHHVVASLNPWWFQTTHKHEALVGLISN